MTKRLPLTPMVGLFLGVALGVAFHATASAMTIDFDDQVVGDTIGTFPGNTYAASGVTFTSGDIPNSIALGDVITLSSPTNQFLIINNNDAISLPNFAAASGVFSSPDDVLMSFATPVLSVTVQTDDAPGEAQDLVRLIALAPTANVNQFTVLGFVQGFDDEISSPGNQLSLDLSGSGFSFAIFQVTTEAEGFDNLTFAPTSAVPEPSTLVLMGSGLAGLTAAAAWTRRRR